MKAKTDLKANSRKTRVLFVDVDNTLFKSKAAAKKADKIVMKFFAKKLGKKYMLVSKKWKKLVKKLKESRKPWKRERKYSYFLLAKSFRKTDKSAKILASEAYKLFLKNFLKELKAKAGVLQLLKKLSRKFHIVAVTENTRCRLNKILNKFRLKSCFSALITADVVGVMKPHKRYFNACINFCKNAGVNIRDAVFIGDNYVKDLADAEKHGCKTIIVRGKFPVRRLAHLF